MNSREKVNQLYASVSNIEKIYENYAKQQGITYYDMQLFYALIENECKPLTQKQFCDEMDLPKTTVNSIVKSQIKQEHIHLEVNPNNKKEKLIYLTEKGLEYAKNLILPLFALEERAASLISEEEVYQLSRILDVFANGLLNQV